MRASDDSFSADFSRANASGHKVMPEHLFAGAYAACFFGALENAAQRAGFELGPDATLTANVRLVEDDDESYRLSVDLHARLPGMGNAEGSKLLHEAHRTCPYSRAVRGNIDVALSLD